jgi:hypothetical protein
LLWTAFSTALMSSSRCALVMPGAPKMPRQLASSTFTPCSFSEGMPSIALAEDTARARILPDLMCCANSESPEMPAATCPPMIAETASPPPLNAT